MTALQSDRIPAVRTPVVARDHLGRWSIPGELIWELDEPAAVSLSLGVGDRRVVWLFARELLRDGLWRRTTDPAGDADVTIGTDFDDLTMHIRLDSPSGEVELLVDWCTVGVFLRSAYLAVSERACTQLITQSLDTWWQTEGTTP